jgi:hypothetical protein
MLGSRETLRVYVDENNDNEGTSGLSDSGEYGGCLFTFALAVVGKEGGEATTLWLEIYQRASVEC